jgi:hypothetical protein
VTSRNYFLHSDLYDFVSAEVSAVVWRSPGTSYAVSGLITFPLSPRVVKGAL